MHSCCYRWVSKVFKLCTYNRLANFTILSMVLRKKSPSQLLNVLHNIHTNSWRSDTNLTQSILILQRLLIKSVMNPYNDTTLIQHWMESSSLVGDTKESLCWGLHLNQFLCGPVLLRDQSLDLFSFLSM